MLPISGECNVEDGFGVSGDGGCAAGHSTHTKDGLGLVHDGEDTLTGRREEDTRYVVMCEHVMNTI